MNKILVVLGPTATGKTDIALDLAKKLDGELVSADSRQVYKGLDLGTGKLPGSEVLLRKHEGFWELDGIKVWMYDVTNPNKQYSIEEYIKKAGKIIKDISQRKKLPILVGGTGFYIRGLISGVDTLTLPVNPKLRIELSKLTLEEMQKKLQKVSPILWNKLNNSDRHNKRRLIRKLEIAEDSIKRSKENGFKGLSQFFSILKVGLTAPRELLNERIDKRLILRIEQGMIEESKYLYNNGLSLSRMDELGLEYRYMGKYLKGDIGLETMINLLKTKIHQYAKRQVTWFQKEEDVHWFNITEDGKLEVEKLVLDWYNKTK